MNKKYRLFIKIPNIDYGSKIDLIVDEVDLRIVIQLDDFKDFRYYRWLSYSYEYDMLLKFANKLKNEEIKNMIDFAEENDYEIYVWGYEYFEVEK